MKLLYGCMCIMAVEFKIWLHILSNSITLWTNNVETFPYAVRALALTPMWRVQLLNMKR